MLAASTLLTSVIAFWLLSCVAVAISGRKVNHSYPSIALFVGGVATIAAACIGWSGDYVWTLPSPIYLSIMPFSSRLDSLSSIFAGLLGFVTTAVSLYSPGYLNRLEKPSYAAYYWIALFLFVSGMLGVILGANAFCFLVWGEIMTLSSIFLVSTNFTSHESRQSAFIYLGATRVATALLIAGFIWMHVLTKSWEFSAWKFSGHETLAPALMIFLAFCIKAGLWPFQAWLPRALREAPAPASALMSAVMVETAVYAILRILVIGGLVSPYVGYVMLGLGMISTLWGILLAFIQQDLRALLAYSSIQNVGLIFISLGLAVIGAFAQLPVVSSLGIAGAVYQCVNHGLCKSLLILGAGAIDSQANTCKLDECGGLGQRMPWTMTGFLIGSAAICALPPLNGFVSNWLIYKSFFQLANLSDSSWFGGLSIACIGALGLVSGLTVATFAKTIGLAFLGRPRSVNAENALEVSLGMRIAQWLLAPLCIAFGLAAPLVLNLIKPICLSAKAGGLTSFPIPMGIFALGVGFLTAFLYFFWLKSDQSSTKKSNTPESAQEDLSSNVQPISAAESSDDALTTMAPLEPIALTSPTLTPLVQEHLDSTIEEQGNRRSPDSISTILASNADIESRYVYGPAVHSIVWLGERMLLFQSGSLHLYLVYMMVTLVALMLVGMLT